MFTLYMSKGIPSDTETTVFLFIVSEIYTSHSYKFIVLSDVIILLFLYNIK